MPSCFYTIYWQLQLSKFTLELLLLYTWSANKFLQANQINHAGINTLFIIRMDLHKIIYPVYLYLQNCQQFVLTLDFLLLHVHICFLTDELFSAHVMSLRAYVMQALRDNNLVIRAFKSDYGCAKIAVQQCGVRMTTPLKEQQGGLLVKEKYVLFLNNFQSFC